MNNKDIISFRDRVARQIDSGRLRDALRELRNFSEARMTWEITDSINRVEQSYELMLGYLTQGMADPGRDDVYDGIVADARRTLDSLVRHAYLDDTPTLYYNTLRYIQLSDSASTAAVLAERYMKEASATSLFDSLTSGTATDSAEARRNSEELERRLFNRLWVSFPLSKADVEAVATMTASDTVPLHARLLALWGVTAGLLEFYDERRMELLMQIYESTDNVKLSTAALLSLILAFYRYRGRKLSKRIALRLAALRDDRRWHDDLQAAFIEIIRTRDTERINRKINEEVIPDMMKMRPDILRRMNDLTIGGDGDEPDINPEWEEMLHNSGLADRLKELSEIQQQGGDVFMSTFSHLKSFSFFNDIANWFMPFHTGHSAVAGSGSDSDTYNVLAEAVDTAPFLCDSDKYSFMIALNMVPAAQRDMMKSQFDAQQAQLDAAMSQLEQADPMTARRSAMSGHLRNLYRFYKLFRRKSEFYDPFADGAFNLTTVPALADDFTDPENLSVVATFYFNLGFYSDSLDTFSRVDEMLEPTADRYQKMGYCCEKLGRLNDALHYYGRAEILAPDNAWTLRHIARCLRDTGNCRGAADYYRRLASMMPDDAAVALQLGYMLTESGDYAAAKEQYFKAAFLDEKSDKALRPLAWTQFLDGDHAAALDTYGKIIEHNPTSEDYLNMGHAYLAAGRLREAINSYKLSAGNNPSAAEAAARVIKAINADSKALTDAGVDVKILPLVTDALLYSLT